jgi:signal transduction histidine kinase
MLDDLGLAPAIEALLDRRRTETLAIESSLRLPSRADTASGLSPELETTVYRVVQESLTNVIKHARASSVRVTVELDAGEVVVEVQDDGRGFDVNARSAGFGVAGMRERVSLTGGSLKLQSDGRGTLVRARLPAGEAEATESSLRYQQLAP